MVSEKSKLNGLKPRKLYETIEDGLIFIDIMFLCKTLENRFKIYTLLYGVEDNTIQLYIEPELKTSTFILCKKFLMDNIPFNKYITLEIKGKIPIIKIYSDRKICYHEDNYLG